LQWQGQAKAQSDAGQPATRASRKLDILTGGRSFGVGGMRSLRVIITLDTHFFDDRAQVV
jgi:hypothetical protein